jgi:hypothetical protein
MTAKGGCTAILIHLLYRLLTSSFGPGQKKTGRFTAYAPRDLPVLEPTGRLNCFKGSFNIYLIESYILAPVRAFTEKPAFFPGKKGDRMKDPNG